MRTNVMCNSYEWQHFMGTWARQGTNATVREFDEKGDAGCIKMPMLAIWM
jgi:hypothetical protein